MKLKSVGVVSRVTHRAGMFVLDLLLIPDETKETFIEHALHKSKGTYRMNPESGSRIAAAVLPALTSGFSTQVTVSGIELNNNSAVGQDDVCAGTAAGARDVPAIWS